VRFEVLRVVEADSLLRYSAVSIRINVQKILRNIVFQTSGPIQNSKTSYVMYILKKDGKLSTERSVNLLPTGSALFYGTEVPSGPGPPHYRGFTITLSYTHLLRWIPLDERSARNRYLHLTAHNNHKRQTSMIPVGFEPTTPASNRSQTQALDSAVIEIGDITSQSITIL
jgi:hypothetical protein